MHSPEIIKAIELVEFICGEPDSLYVTLSYGDGGLDLTKFNDLASLLENSSLTVSVENGSFFLDEKTFPRDTAEKEIVRFILKSGLKLAKKIRKMEKGLGTVTFEAVEQEITAAKIEPPMFWRKNYYAFDSSMETIYIDQASDTKKKRKKK